MSIDNLTRKIDPELISIKKPHKDTLGNPIPGSVSVRYLCQCGTLNNKEIDIEDIRTPIIKKCTSYICNVKYEIRFDESSIAKIYSIADNMGQIHVEITKQ